LPKWLKVGKDFKEHEVEALFGPCINKNGYRYTYTNDEEVIAFVEMLWMTMHQRTQVPSICMTNKVAIKRIVCERKGKQVN
jgi:hypothetical protein